MTARYVMAICRPTATPSGPGMDRHVAEGMCRPNVDPIFNKDRFADRFNLTRPTAPGSTDSTAEEETQAVGRNLALTSPTPPRRGRAWNPVAPHGSPREDEPMILETTHVLVSGLARGMAARSRGSSLSRSCGGSTSLRAVTVQASKETQQVMYAGVLVEQAASQKELATARNAIDLVLNAKGEPTPPSAPTTAHGRGGAGAEAPRRPPMTSGALAEEQCPWSPKMLPQLRVPNFFGSSVVTLPNGRDSSRRIGARHRRTLGTALRDFETTEGRCTAPSSSRPSWTRPIRR